MPANCDGIAASLDASELMRVTVKPKRKDELLIDDSAFGCRVDI
jgi:hypothetical protein